jgi:hypothetical protein
MLALPNKSSITDLLYSENSFFGYWISGMHTSKIMKPSICVLPQGDNPSVGFHISGNLPSGVDLLFLYL